MHISRIQNQSKIIKINAQQQKQQYSATSLESQYERLLWTFLLLFYATATKYNKNKFRMMIQRRFRSCCECYSATAYCGYCYCCCCSRCCRRWRSMPDLLFCCCFVAADLVFVYRNRNRNRNPLPFAFWFLLAARLLLYIAVKTYNLSSLLLLLSSRLAAAWVATAAATTFDFRFEFSSSFLQLLHTTLISTQRCTNTHWHWHTRILALKFIRSRHESPCIHIDM